MKKYGSYKKVLRKNYKTDRGFLNAFYRKNKEKIDRMYETESVDTGKSYKSRFVNAVLDNMYRSKLVHGVPRRTKERYKYISAGGDVKQQSITTALSKTVRSELFTSREERAYSNFMESLETYKGSKSIIKGILRTKTGTKGISESDVRKVSKDTFIVSKTWTDAQGNERTRDVLRIDYENSPKRVTISEVPLPEEEQGPVRSYSIDADFGGGEDDEEA